MVQRKVEEGGGSVVATLPSGVVQARGRKEVAPSKSGARPDRD
jgi:hypothetical protein